MGTNGAHYRHLDTRQRIHEADNALHLSMGRNDRVIGNVTFCRRGNSWYVRYFAVDKVLQATGKKKSSSTSGRLKQELRTFFNHVLSEEKPFGDVQSFYAYIDPNNEKSLWMSETFGFKSIANIATQTFSRVRLPKSTLVTKITDWEEVRRTLQNHFSNQQYYFDAHLQKGPFYVIRDDNGEIVAFAKVTRASWVIERLPGKNGAWLPKIIPFIPGLRRIIKPKNHTFVVPEAVYVKDNDPAALEQLFEGILKCENEHLILWWVDEKAPLYKDVKQTMKWGILNKLVGVNNAQLMVKHNDLYQPDYSTPVYTCGFDFV